MNSLQLAFKRLAPDAKLPTRATPGSFGLDLYAYLISDTGRPNTLIMPPRQVRKIRTAIAVQPPPDGWLVQPVSRSGLAAKHSIFVSNAPGVIDEDYRGEIHVLLYNGGHETYYVKHEDRIAQLIVVQASFLTPVEVTDLSPTGTRGEAGYGSTGR